MITNIEDIEIYVRNQLIKQSEIPANNVKNALSLYGSHMAYNSSGNVFTSYCVEDKIIFFELMNEDNSEDVVDVENNDNLTFYRHFYIRVILYGDGIVNTSNKLYARFRSEKVKTDFLENDIHIVGISLPLQNTEYINNVLWQRNDMRIDLEVKLTYNQVDDNYQIQTINEINVKEKT